MIHSKKVSEGNERFFILGTLINVVELEGINVEISPAISILSALGQIEKIKAADAEQMEAVSQSTDPSRAEKEEEVSIDGEEVKEL